MAKNLKLNIKSTQLQKALKLKSKLGKAEGEKSVKKKPVAKPSEEIAPVETESPPPKRKIRARTKSAFAPTEMQDNQPTEAVAPEPPDVPSAVAEPSEKKQAPVEPTPKPSTRPIESKPVPAKPAPKRSELGLPRVAPKRLDYGKVKPPVKESKVAKPAPASQPKRSFEKKRRTFRDVKPKTGMGRFDARDRKGLRAGDDERWRKRRGHRPSRQINEELTVRPTELSIRLPISLKEFAMAMKLKASQLISKLLMQGIAMTLNDVLEDETTVQLLGNEFGCTISIDTSEEKRLRITDQTIKEEIATVSKDQLKARAPVVTFMGHVDHGKTSLIDRIRETNVASQEAGAITQHIGAFQAQTAVGPITILDTPGHEAFTSMRARGADVTDVVVLVVAGDEGVRPQTEEAIQHAKAGGVTLMVAINKCDKPGFNAENVYRQLAELELMPEAWGGDVVTVNCSAVSGDGMDTLLEMIALQTEVLELKANPLGRARGTVLESQMHKGLGAVATVLVQNGTLHHQDAIVFGTHWGRVKTMQDEFGKHFKAADPATPVAITGLSGLPAAGSEFIVVPTEKEAREIAEARRVGERERELQKKRRITMEHLMEEAQGAEQKHLNLILRADVQGSLEALKQSLSKVGSEKARLEVIFAGVGAISESDVELAIASNAVIVGFHTQVESHADELIRQAKVKVRCHDVIYHAIDDVKVLLTGQLEKLAEKRDTGAAEVRAIFKASQLGTIAGCYITDGVINRNSHIRQKRGGEVVWEGTVTSIRREQDDVKEVKAGLECGLLLNGQNDIDEGDILESYEIVYVTQEL